MKVVKTTIAIILFLSLCTAAYPLEEPGAVKEESVSAQEKTAPAKDDDRPPIFKEGWQFFVAPYLWIPGAHLSVSQQGRTSVVDIPWYNVVPKLFSNAIGGMGTVEIWYNKWGFFSDTNFLYMSDSVSGGGGKTLELKNSALPAPIPLRLDIAGKVTVWTRLLWQDAGLRYLLATVPLKADKPLPALAVELFGGLRYTYINQDVKLNLNATLSGPPTGVLISKGGSFYSSSESSFVEPLVGLRFGLWMTPKLNLLLRADCGGFGFVAYNNVDTVLEGLVGYQLTKNTRLYAGYRARYASASNNVNSVHGWFQGPMLGTVYNF